MDPAWGTTLSDEETARALCAFQHTQPSLTQHRQQPRSEPQNRMSAFGYSAPLTIGRNEAASLLVEMHAPSTLSGDWKRQQQVAIQDQLERDRRVLETQAKQQQQRTMHLQLQQLQTQLHEQAQAQQMQVQQQVERIQHSRYLSAASGFAQANGATSNTFEGEAGDRNSFGAQQRQQSGQYYDVKFGRKQQLLNTAPLPVYRERLPVSRSEVMFAPPQPVPPPRNLEKPPATAPHQWGSRETISLSGGQTNASSAFQRWTTQRFLPQHPQPYHPVEFTERNRQEVASLQNSSRQRPDEAFLNGIMKHFPTSTGAPTSSAMVSYGSSAGSSGSGPGYAAPRSLKSVFDSMAQDRLQAPTLLHRQTDTHSRPPIPPTGAAVVPGVALAPQSSRLLTMRDILNGDDTSRIDLPRNQQRGGKQKRAPPKRKTPRKKITAKRQRNPQQQNEQRIQPPPPRRSAGGVQEQQGSNLAGPAVKMPTPMYRAFMDSRAARAQEQSDSHRMELAPPPVIPSRRAIPATQSVAIFDCPSNDQVANAADKPKPVKTKKIAAVGNTALAPVQPSQLEVSASSVVPTPVVPRVENRTVVLFCKRDFMRYQAAKIWRKYQEQLKKHEEWREVRVAGKRTRYLNSRYDEIQRTHKKTHTRSGKPRRKPQVARGHKTLASAADSTPTESSSTCPLMADEGDSRSEGIDPTVGTMKAETVAKGDIESTDAGLEGLISTSVDESLKEASTPSITESFSTCAIDLPTS
ncbi:hypothetical protein DVH05_011400 [Phytophthora capsici]|nr:hypothetical protein DVH05_011400 [Phytophthora capsici]